MRKFFLFCAALVAAVACSCGNGDKSFGIEYALDSDGTTDGYVEVAFPAGQFSISGDASYQFYWSNVDQVMDGEAMSLEKGLCAKDAKVAEAAGRVESWLEDAVRVTDAGGNYDIYVKGYVRETFTGLTFSVDKHFTNKEEE